MRGIETHRTLETRTASVALSSPAPIPAPLYWLFAAVTTLSQCDPASAEPLPPTKLVPVGSACFLVDDETTPERETELVIVKAPSALTARVRLDRCSAEFDVSEACQGKLAACEAARKATVVEDSDGFMTGLKWTGLIIGAVAIFAAGVAVGR